MTSWKNKHWTEIQNIDKTKWKNDQNKNPSCQFFAFTFLSIQFKFMQCPSRNSFLKILIYIFCHPWSEGCIVVAFPLQQFGYLHIPSYLLWTPDNLNFRWLKLVLISLEGSSYWELTVVQINNPRTTKGDPITFPVYI